MPNREIGWNRGGIEAVGGRGEYQGYTRIIIRREIQRDWRSKAKHLQDRCKVRNTVLYISATLVRIYSLQQLDATSVTPLTLPD